MGFNWAMPSSADTDGLSGLAAPGIWVAVNLIDTLGDVNFSVEVSQSVAILDCPVLAGSVAVAARTAHGAHPREPLLVLLPIVNKMDRAGTDFRRALASRTATQPSDGRRSRGTTGTRGRRPPSVPPLWAAGCCAFWAILVNAASRATAIVDGDGRGDAVHAGTL